METPDFWIGRMQDPDKTVLSAEEIARFNDSITRRGSTVDVAGLENIDGARLRSEISAPLKTLSGSKLYFSDSTPVTRGFWSRLQALMALRSIPEKVRVRHAFVALRAEQRALPSDAVVTVKPGDIDFDEMQNSSLDIWTPVAVAHESADGKWVYANGVSSSGWLKKSNIAFCGREQMTAMLKRPFAVVTAPKAAVHGERVRMGVVLPLSGRPAPEGAFTGILFPVRDSRGGLRESEGSLPRESVSVGFLPYTQRTILVQ
ncbi:MAG: SH3 domain-containing protein, partial [Deltaproteobacteria bacterium]